MKELPIIILEIGINHNGSVDVAKQMIDASLDAVDRNEYPRERVFWKFQKRSPEICVPKHMWSTPRTSLKTGKTITYLDYKFEIEFGLKEYTEIDEYTKVLGVENQWFASVWDNQSVDFMGQFPYVPFLKIPSALLTDDALIHKCIEDGRPMIMSTGMSTLAEIDHAYNLIPEAQSFILMACTAAYPCFDPDVHLNKIGLLRALFGNGLRIGYSNHSPSSFIPIYASLLGAEAIELHITLNRALPGSDHAASLEMRGLDIVLREIKRHPIVMGPDEIVVFDSELSKRKSLRGT